VSDGPTGVYFLINIQLHPNPCISAPVAGLQLKRNPVFLLDKPFITSVLI
jgi:hypothetical protein